MSDGTEKKTPEQVYREVALKEPKTGRRTPFQDLLMRVAFGEVWQAPGLSRRERRLISLACCAHVADAPLQHHVHLALKSGDLDMATMEAFTVHLAIYAGFPTAVRVQDIIDHIIEDEAKGVGH